MTPTKVAFFASLLTIFVATTHAQAIYTAWSVNQVVKGNHETKDYGILNDFRVNQPITITSLGAFDSDGDGFKGAGTITVQIYQRQPEDKGAVLLETATFDAGNQGTLAGGYRFNTLVMPVTLLPGVYAITATGFSGQDKEYNFIRDPDPESVAPQLTLNNGGGVIEFLGCNRYHGNDPTDNSDQAKNIGPASRFAAGTFTFQLAQPYASATAADYAALVSGVGSFPVDTGKSNAYDGVVTLNRYGSIALLEDSSFPILMEPSGNRLIFEAAGLYGGNANASRCVMFAHEQWGHATGDARMTQFENAIKWAGRKSNPADIVLGVSANLNVAYFASHGYQVRVVDPNMKTNDENTLTGCDVVVVDFHGKYTERFYTRLAEYTANGGGLVGTFLPWRYVHGGIRPAYNRVNAILQPYGMSYRSSQTMVGDWGFTNICASGYPPLLFNAFPAAQLLREDRLGQIQLTSLEKSIAMHTISYAADRRADRIAALTAIYSGSGNGSSTPLPSNFADLLTVAGSAGTFNNDGATNGPAGWNATGTSLLSIGSRGAVDYDLNVSAADVYRLQVAGSQVSTESDNGRINLNLSLDGISLGQYSFDLSAGEPGLVQCLTPHLTVGNHRLRVFWDNADVQNQLRIDGIHLQSATGADADGNGIKDWVDTLVNAQSGLDLTNAVVASYVSPLCLEGRDPWVGLISADVSGADRNTSHLTPQSAPNGRWYLNIPLASEGDSALNITYQNGAKSEQRQLQWWPVNVLQGGSFTIRKGDSLSLIGRPDASVTKDPGHVVFTIGANQYPSRLASFQMPHAFSDIGPVTVSATYTSTNGTTQSGSITVNVVEHHFASSPDCWVGMDRDWDTYLPSEAVLEADSRLFITPVALLPDGGWRNRILIDQSESRYFLSRLGTNGPVLGSGVARGFNFWHGKDTYTRVKQTYDDGSQLVEMLLVLSPVIGDLKVKLDVIVGGVIFEDGTIAKTLTAAHFDAQGRCVVRFIRPASAKTSVCHSITVWQGATLVGQVY